MGKQSDLVMRDVQLLNPLDVAIRCADQSIRGMGYPGFETQMLVWLSGRLDIACLQLALERLSHRRPVITARLIEDDLRHGRPHWQFRNSVAKVDQIELPSATMTAVLECAAKLLSEKRDLDVDPPLRFYVLHRPNGEDVFLLQYTHVLMDRSATVQVLREIASLYESDHSADLTPQYESTTALNRWLMRLPHADRRLASSAAIELQGRVLRGRAAILGTGEEDKPRQLKLRIASQSLDSDSVRALHDSSAKLCGLPNLSMAILASAFRAIGLLGPPERNAERLYIAGIGLDMKQRRADQALLQNLLSIVSIFARPHELLDRNQLILTLSQQVRERLRGKVDWGALRLVNAYYHKPRYIQWVVEHLLRWTCSLWYAYFGSLDSVGKQFCECPIETIQYVGPTWSPMGLSLLANQFQGRLHFQVTYDPDLVNSELIQQFLDFVLADLKDFSNS
jgi:hypothetical protein